MTPMPETIRDQQNREIRHVIYDVVEIVPMMPTLTEAESRARDLLHAAYWALGRGDRPEAMRQAQEAIGQMVLADAITRQESRSTDLTGEPR